MAWAFYDKNGRHKRTGQRGAVGDTGATGATGGAGPGLPPGVTVPYVGSAAPSGWLLCDGSFVSTTTYADLFAVAGHAYNGGTDPADGTFKLPDLRQKLPLGKAAAGTGSTLGGTGGAIDHPHSAGVHTGGITSSGSGTSGSEAAHTHNVIGSGNNQISAASGVSFTALWLQGSPNLTMGGSSHAHTTPAHTHTDNYTHPNTGTNNPPFQVLNYIVKT